MNKTRTTFPIKALPAILLGICTLTAQAFDGGTTNLSSDASFINLYVGYDNSNTQVSIADGVTITASKQVSLGANEGSTNNTLTLTGTATLVSGSTSYTNSTGGIVIGKSGNGSNPAMTINNASTAEAGYFYMGAASNDIASVKVTGHGSQLNILNDAVIGGAASDNKLNISDGASFSVGNNLYVGSTNTTGNAVNINDESTLSVGSLTNIVITGNNNVSIYSGGTLHIAGDIDTTDLDDHDIDVRSGAKLAVDQTFTAKDDAIENGLNVILNTSNAVWNIAHPGEEASFVGQNTANNSLTLTNGASTTISNQLVVGDQSASNNNKVNITGNAALTLQKSLTIGGYGSNNQLNIEEGSLDVNTSIIVGKNSSASGNQINIGSNAVVNIGSDVVVGNSGSGNSFTIAGGQLDVGNDFILGSGSANNRYNQTDGTNTVAGAFVIGKTEGATGKTGNVDDDIVETTGNLAIIGTNATLNIQQDLTVGLEGGGSIMTIRDGGIVTVDGNTVIGEAVGDNYIYLQRDSNTQFNVTGDLVVGKSEEGSNRFAVYGGTANIGGNFYLGATTNQHEIKNFVYLETTNAALNVANALYIGASNSINTLDIVDGATVRAQDLYVGTYEGVSNNVVTVKGENALLYVTNTLEIGSSTGTNNSIVVENGGILNVTQTGIVISGEDNILNIANGGTLQTIDWAATNLDENIVFDAGSTLELGGAYTGTNRQDSSFGLVLNGSLATNNALWNTGSEILYVGYVEDENTLTAKDGGMVATDTDLIVGRTGKTTGNELKSTGTGSLIDAGNNLIIGRNGSSNNKLAIEDGGQGVIGNNLIIGSASGGNNGLISGLSNSVSTLTIGNTLTIGQGADATGNALEISTNATVTVSGIATIGSNANNNMMEITGTNAFFNALTNFVIGAGEASGNEFAITEGTAIVEGDLIIGRDVDSTGNSGTVSGSNSTLQILSDLYLGKDGSENTFTVSDGALLEAANVYVGFTTNSLNNTLSVTGSNTMANISGNLYAGYEGEDNLIEVLDGASLTVFNAYINNQITVFGSNTLFNVVNDMLLGDAFMDVSDQAYVSIGNDLSLSNSFMGIDVGSQVVVDGDYSQDEFSTLAVRVSTNYATTNLTVVKTASFAKNTTFAIQDDDTVVGETNNVARAIVSAGEELKINDQTATQDLLNDYIIIQNDLLDFNLILSNNVIWVDNFTRLSLAMASGLEEGTQLADIADEIDFMADSSNEVAVSMRDFMDIELDSNGRNTAFHNYYGEKMSSSPAHNAINMGMQSVSEQLTKRSDSTRARMGMASANGPDGAGGPHMAGQSMQGWVAGYKTWADKSSDSGFDGYDGSIGGFMVGADLSVAEGILVGIAGGAGNATLDKDNGASTDTDTTFGSIYISAGTKDWFADASLIYGGSSVDTALGSLFDTKASYDAQNTAIYVGGGKEIIGNYLIITPQASLLGNYYKQDSYEEKSSDAVARMVDSFDTLYIQSSIGCNAGFYTAMGDLILKPEFRAFWVHEFNAKDEDVSFQLIDGTGTAYNMLLQAPEEDIIKLGAGLSAKIGEYLELRADLDTRRGSNYSDYTLLGSIRYRF